jgi:hypothetical protein
MRGTPWQHIGRNAGFDHGAGHALLLLGNAKAPNYSKNKAFNDLAHYSEWPKVAGAVIKAEMRMITAAFPRALHRWTGRIRTRFRSILQEVRPISKTRNQFNTKVFSHTTKSGTGMNTGS